VKLGEVLVIDDRDADRLHARSVLEDAELATSVIPFRIAMDALAFLQRPQGHAADLILLAIDMPDMSGFEFLLAYERLHPSQRARALVAMVDAGVDARAQARAIGFGCVTRHLVKPLCIADARCLADLVASLSLAR
jgi:CheY-like chemotaxis protein